VRFAIKASEVDRQHDEDPDVKCDPEPEWHERLDFHAHYRAANRKS
jgi:hypothetical protein